MSVLDLFRSILIDEWATVTQVAVEQVLSDAGSVFHLKVKLTPTKLPVYDWDSNWDCVEWRAPTLEACCDVVVSALQRLAKALRIKRLWHEDVKSQIGRKIVFQGRHVRYSDGKEAYLPDRYWKIHREQGLDGLSFSAKIDLLRANQIEIVPGTIGDVVAYVEGRLLIKVRDLEIWMPGWHLRPSTVTTDGAPVLGTEHAVWVQS